MSEPIPVDAVVAQALMQRPTFPVGSGVWVRRSDNGAIEVHEVIGIFLVMTNAVDFRMHYMLGLPRHYRPERPISRRIVPWHHVYATLEEARANDNRPSNMDPLDADIQLAVQTHRKHFANAQRRA